MAAYKTAALAYNQDAAIVKAKEAYLSAIKNAKDEAARATARAQYQAARDDYFKDKGYMKLLASAKAGDLTWDANGVTLKRQVPITVSDTDGGSVQLVGRDNVYVMVWQLWRTSK